MPQTTSQSINNPTSPVISGAQPVSLKTLFQVVTCCCVFFAVLRFSPLLALIFTLILAPSLIRTAYVAECFRQKDQPLNLKSRMKVFSKAIGEVLLTMLAGFSAFVIVSLGFGLLGLLFGFAVAQSDFLFEAGIIGTVGGMIWGMAGAFLTMVFFMVRFWNSSSIG